MNLRLMAPMTVEPAAGVRLGEVVIGLGEVFDPRGAVSMIVHRSHQAAGEPRPATPRAASE